MEVWIFFLLILSSMGKGTRGDFQKAHGNPGPGTYQAKSSLAGSKFHFGGRYSQSKSELQPGPGQYNADFKTRPATSGFTMGGRSSSSVRGNGAPGPGSYDVKVQKEKIAGRFGKDSRKGLNYSTNAAPGPGAYEARPYTANTANAPKYSFSGRTGDNQLGKSSGIPGPGTYNYKSCIGNEGVKATISGHRPTTAIMNSQYVPGPGAYNVSASKNAPAYK